MSWGRGSGSPGDRVKNTNDWNEGGGQEEDVLGGGFEDTYDSGVVSSGATDWGSTTTTDTTGWGSNEEGTEGFDDYADDRGPRAPPGQLGGSQQQQQPPSRYPPRQGQPEQGMMDQEKTRKRLGYGLCVAQFLINGVQGGMIGSIFGAFSGASEGYSAGARGKPLVVHILYRARSSAFSFGVWIGSYSGAKCAFITMRNGKKDAFNGTCIFFYAARTPAAFLAGAVAGALPALASRNPRTILFSAMGSAGLMGMMESVEGIFGGAGKGGGGLGDGGGD